MKHPERVEDYLEHIAEAIRRATEYLQAAPDGKERETDRLLQDAVARNIEIIGEAANQIQRMDPSFASRHPELPWPEMRGMRNKMVHGYFDVEWEIVWATVKTDLPLLQKQIESLLLRLRQEKGK